jgi:uncharacterized protein (DUF4415 family)
MKRKSETTKDKALERELRELAAKPEQDVNLSDMPEVRDWSKAERGRFFRPVKQQLTLRLDADLVEWFKAQGLKGYQSRINQALRRFVEAHKRHAA